jgi:hypothetical protein
MFTEDAGATDTSNSNGTLDCDNSDEGDPDEASDSFLPLFSDIPYRDEPIESNGSSSLGSRLIRESPTTFLFEENLKTNNLRWKAAFDLGFSYPSTVPMKTTSDTCIVVRHPPPKLGDVGQGGTLL